MNLLVRWLGATAFAFAVFAGTVVVVDHFPSSDILDAAVSFTTGVLAFHLMMVATGGFPT